MDCQTQLSRIERPSPLADPENAIEHLYCRIVNLLLCLGASGSIARSDDSSGSISSRFDSSIFPVGPNVGLGPVESGYSAPSSGDGCDPGF